ncbi:MAG: hypothetical protein OXR62_03505 [Ahrensia sp.]|nr:hypothetical protein [Ahrensia sp.]
MRLVLVLLFALCVPPAHASQRSIVFVAIAQIKAGQEPRYDAFIEAITPVWNRHGMHVLARARPVRSTSANIISPDSVVDIAVLGVTSRAGFHDYLSDPDYQGLKGDRLVAVDALIIVDGHTDATSSPPATADQLVVRLQSVDGSRNRAIIRKDSAFSIVIDEVAAVKGAVSPSLAKAKRVSIIYKSAKAEPTPEDILSGPLLPR